MAIATALLVVAGAAALARIAGLLLPDQPALIAGIAVTVVLPGWALGRASGLGDRLDALALLGATPALGLAAWLPPLAVALALRLPFGAVLAMLALMTVAMLAMRPLRPGPVRRVDAISLALLAAFTAFAAGRWQEPLRGDEIFHLARARKLLAVPHLSLDAVSELSGGRPHAGYVVPLLHAVEAGALRICGIDVTAGFPDLVPAAAVLLVLAAFAAGRAVAGTAAGVATVTLTVWAAMIGLHPTLGKVSWPGPFTFLVLFPVGILAVSEVLRRPEDRRLQGLLAASVLVVAVVHVSYALPLLAILAGAVAFARRGLVGLLAAAAAAAAVFAFVWLEALHGAPSPKIAAGPWRHATSDAFVIVHGHPLALNARTITQHQTGFLIAIAALVPMLLWRAPRYAYPAGLVAGGLALVAVPGFVPLLNATVGIGQSHRFGEAIPWQPLVATLAALTVVNFSRRWILPIAIAAVLVAAIGPARVKSFWDVAPAVPTTPLALAAIVIAGWYALRRLRALPLPPVQAAVLPTLLVAMVMVMAPDPSSSRQIGRELVHGHPNFAATTVPTPIVRWLAEHGGTMPTVLMDELRAYRLGAYSDAYVVAVPEVRTRAEPASDPEQRRRDVSTFLSPDTSQAQRDAILRRYGVDVVIAPDNPALLRQLRADPLLQERLDADNLVIFSVRE